MRTAAAASGKGVAKQGPAAMGRRYSAPGDGLMDGVSRPIGRPLDGLDGSALGAQGQDEAFLVSGLL